MIGDSESWKIYYEGTGLDGFSALFIDQNFMIALSTSTFIQSGLYAVQEIGTESIIQTKPRKAFFLIMNRAKWHHIITLQACLRWLLLTRTWPCVRWASSASSSPAFSSIDLVDARFCSSHSLCWPSSTLPSTSRCTSSIRTGYELVDNHGFLTIT